MHGAHLKSGGRYPVLRSVAILLLVSGVIELVAGVVAVVWWHSEHGVMNRFTEVSTMAAILGGTFLGFLGIVALAELIKLLIDIEHNTRVGAAAGASGSAALGPNGGPRMRTLMGGEETAEGAPMRGH